MVNVYLLLYFPLRQLRFPRSGVVRLGALAGPRRVLPVHLSVCVFVKHLALRRSKDNQWHPAVSV